MPSAVKPAHESMISTPRTLTEALALLAAAPGAMIYAGGTALFQNGSAHGFPLPSRVISLQDLDEIRRILPHDRFWELGAGVTLGQLLAQGRAFLPPLLRHAVLGIGNTPIRNLGTIGGNLCQSGRHGDLFPALYLLGAQVEIRSNRSAQWLSSHQVFEAPVFPVAPGELVSRIRIPLERWNQTFYQRIGLFRTPWDEQITLLGLVRVSGSSLSTLRLGFHLPQSGVIRNRSSEASLSGQGLPLGKRERSQVIDGLISECDHLEHPVSSYQIDQIRRLTRTALDQIQIEDL